MGELRHAGTQWVHGSWSGPLALPYGQGHSRAPCTVKAELQQLTMATESTSHWNWGVSTSYQKAGSAGLAWGLPERRCYCKPWTAEYFQTRCEEEELLARQLASLSQLWPFPKLLLPREQKAHPAIRPRPTLLQSGASLG